MAIEIELGSGFSLWTDQDGDWWLMPPEDMTIVSVPGESLLIGTCSEQVAREDAAKFMAGLPQSPVSMSCFLTKEDQAAASA